MEKFDNRLHYDLTVQMKPLRGYKGSKADHYYLSKLLDAGIEKL